MFESSFSDREKPGAGPPAPPVYSPSADRIDALALLIWDEHCVECAPPTCYSTCLHYKARADQKCVRLDGGFTPSHKYQTALGPAVYCQFRKWAKIETFFSPLSVTVPQQRLLRFVFHATAMFFKALAYVAYPFSKTMKPLGAYAYFRNRLLTALARGKTADFDYFYLEVFSEMDSPRTLLLQCDVSNLIRYRQAFPIQPGRNFFKVPFQDFNLRPGERTRIFILPEEDGRCACYITLMDFVKEPPAPAPAAAPAKAPSLQPADKAKCVVWDLDNTLWKGILSEDGLHKLVLNTDAVRTIVELDKKGILHSIASKNDHQDAMNALRHFGLADYFIFPAINWGQKSHNLREIARNINIGLDTFVFIDDNVVERAEVSQALPQVRVFAETRVPELSGEPCFDVAVSAFSAERRKHYLAETNRNLIKASFSSDYDTFLRELGLVLTPYELAEPSVQERCYELLQRSNQLNLTTRRYTKSEFDQLVQDGAVWKFAFACRDKFGDYGIIGFASLRLEAGTATLGDLVLSCRVSQRKIEQAIVSFLAEKLSAAGISRLAVSLVKTGKNGPLIEVFNQLPFDSAVETGDVIAYKSEHLQKFAHESIFEIAPVAR